MRLCCGRWLIIASCALAGSVGPPAASAQTSALRVASGLSAPVFAGHAPGDASRLFLLEQGSAGTARIRTLNLSTGTLATYLTISGLQTGGERGLLGLAFHPDFANNGHLYVNVTASNQTQIRRYTANGNPLTSTSANAASLSNVLSFNQPFSNHNAGWLGFNPNISGHDPQYLYIATGDGGSGGDPQNNAQDITNNRLGKMLRIDVNGDDFPANSTANYAIPASNPFVGTTGDDEIWAYGLRNPYRNSFDRNTGDLWIADVGQGAIEEIDFQSAASGGGENYGWRVKEGNNCYDNSQAGGNPNCSATVFTDPIYTYGHNSGSFGGFSVTGGYVYEGSVDRFDGQYFFADYVTNNIWSIDPYAVNVPGSVRNRNSLLPTNTSSISGIASFGEDQQGEMYIVSYSNGNVFRVTSTSQIARWEGGTLAGTPGDGTSWSDPDNWSRGNTVDTAPVADDTVLFPFVSPNTTTVNLGGARVVAAATFDGNFALTGGNLQVLSGNIDVAINALATIEGNLAAETANHSLRKKGDGTLRINGAAGQMVVLQGTLSGNGSATYLKVFAGANVAPGESAGQLSVVNDFTMEAGSTLQIELGGTTPVLEYDLLQVGRTATLDGELRIDDIDGYGPTVRGSTDAFTLITAANIDGTFDAATYNGQPLVPLAGVDPEGSYTSHAGDGLFQTLRYSPDSVVLEHYFALDGDANGDGFVDVSDFNIWNLNKFNTGTDWLSGDFNGDGTTDVSDFNIWNVNKFQSVGAAVPEPSSLMTLALAGLALIAVRERRRSSRGGRGLR